MSESDFWRSIRPKLSPYGRFKRIEDRAAAGTPDVYYCIRGAAGWIELKFIPKAPTRPTTCLRIEHLTLDQVTWLLDETNAGGRAWLLMQIEREYFLTDAAVANQIYHHQLTMDNLRIAAAVCAHGAFPTTEVLKCLIKTSI